MLSKLLKYEIKATARMFLPIYTVLLVIAVVNHLVTSLSAREWQAPAVISMVIYIMILVGMFVLTFVVMIQRFYKNLLSDEGYLMFTLPAEAWKHIVSKLLVSMMWVAVSGIAAILSIFIIAYKEIYNGLVILDIINGIADLMTYLGNSAALFILEAFLAVIIGLASNVLIIYASIAVGHLFNKHRVLASLGAFIALTTASQVLFTLIGYICGNLNLNVHISTPNDFLSAIPLIHYAAWFLIIFVGILSAGYFVLTNYILSRRLNLE